MPLHITKTDDGEHAMCICHNPIGLKTPEGDTELGILLPCGHLFGDLCLRKMKEAQGSIVCALCRASVPSTMARMSAETRSRLERDIMPVPTARDVIGDQLHLLTQFDNPARTEFANHSHSNAEVLTIPLWLGGQDLQTLLNRLTAANFRSIANMRHTTIWPSENLSAIMALYTAREVEEIHQILQSTAGVSGSMTIAALADEPGGPFDTTDDEILGIRPTLTPDVASRIRRILYRPLHRRYNTRLNGFVLADNLDVVMREESPPSQPIRPGAWTAMLSF